MAILMIIGVICHRLGINPGQVFFMLNMANRAGRHHRGGMYHNRGFGAGGFGAGPGMGFRFGGGRNRFGRRRY